MRPQLNINPGDYRAVRPRRWHGGGPRANGRHRLNRLLDRCAEHGTWKRGIVREAALAVCTELARLTTEARDAVLSEALAAYARREFTKDGLLTTEVAQVGGGGER